MKTRALVLLMALGAQALVGCAHSTRKDTWKLSRTEKDQHPEESIQLDVKAVGGSAWKVTAQALETRRDYQVWSVRRAFVLSSEQSWHEYFVWVPAQLGSQPKPGEPSDKDLPPELAKEHPAPVHEPSLKQGAKVLVQWRFTVERDGKFKDFPSEQLRGEFVGSGSIKLAPGGHEALSRELKLGRKVRLNVDAKPDGWGDDGVAKSMTIHVNLGNLEPSTGASKSRSPGSGVGSGQP